MKHKKGASGLLIFILVLGIVAVVGSVAYLGTKQSVVQEETLKIQGCDNEPYIDNATFNEYSKGTSVGVTYKYVKKGAKDQIAKDLTPGSSGTKFQVGDELTIFTTASGYLDKVDDMTITECGANEFTNTIAQADCITIDILDNRNNQVTDSASGGAVNLSDGGAETSVDFVIEVKGARDKETGQVLLTLEGNDTELNDISIKPLTSGASVIDDSYNTDLGLFASEGTAPVQKFAFVVDSVNDGGYDQYSLTATAESGQTLGASASSGFLYVNAYAGQWFVDTDGTLKYGWEDADKTAKYEEKAGDHDALFS